MASTHPLRVGVIGAGNAATHDHLPSLKRLANVEIAGICDLNLERARQVADQFGVRMARQNHEELLAHKSGADMFAAIYGERTPIRLYRDEGGAPAEIIPNVPHPPESDADRSIADFIAAPARIESFNALISRTIHKACGISNLDYL